uniref:Methyltransferase n=1 Tax=Kalanchoe fedtschenkoi TaxID=63787 RepID=A0A7N0U6D5_KALFE
MPTPPQPQYSLYQKPTSRRPTLFSIILVTTLCIISYSLGSLRSSPATAAATPRSTTFLQIHPSPPCNTTSTNPDPTQSTQSTQPESIPTVPNDAKKLDFSARHGDSGPDPTRTALKPHPPCDPTLSEHTPCEDLTRSLAFPRDRLIYRERHCPPPHDRLQCRVPAPYGYKTPFRWPKSRDLAWYANVPHKELTVEKAVQNWIRSEGDDKFRFPGGGTMFPKGADAYIDDIGKLIDLRHGSIRTAVDTGCGVASFGAYLMSRDILTVSFAPRDTHEAQVQFALERGVPALIGVLASIRLPYSSRAFDIAHCSRCLIPWGQYDGLYLIEVDRILRPGGFWILSGPPINWRKHHNGWNRTQEDLNSEQRLIERVAKSLCWKKFQEKGDLAIWQKPVNHLHCKPRKPSFCPNPDPDTAWYTKLETCLTPLPNVSSDAETSGGALEKWPKRLHAVPPRIKSGLVEGISEEAFKQDSERWKKRVEHYKHVNSEIKRGRYRNILDMNANLGGFAAALIKEPSWVMNAVPVNVTKNTLGTIYERGLIGTYQDWCEAMSTYPRTYDLIHADSIFTLYDGRCEMDDILLEMDRILRPEGSVIFRDDVDVIIKIQRTIERLEWDSQVVDHEDGPLVREKLLFAVKRYWTAPGPDGDSNKKPKKKSRRH